MIGSIPIKQKWEARSSYLALYPLWMCVLDINENTIDAVINDVWNEVQSKVKAGSMLSSEKTLVFMFAMQLVYKVGKNLKVDFENRCYENLDGSSKYLDLLFYTDDTYKVALEFKLPKKSSGGASNQPETREAIYRDIGRLMYLKSNELKPKACYFLMGVNEPAYLNSGRYRRSPELITAHNHQISQENSIVVDGVSLNGCVVSFIWTDIVQENNKYICNQEYAWLTPIRV
ncbi:hypothetical protein [Photobacterium profundum]|uniref:hypothetical protein n=1 Tax=Photobacterium profundum TaxID=74109 RepID=UPI003D14462F